MEWVNATEKPEDWGEVVLREIKTKRLITNVWAFHDDGVELENGNCIAGETIRYELLEWLKE